MSNKKYDKSNLPEDPAILQDMVRQLIDHNELLSRRLEEFARNRFGKSSEKLNSDQLSLFAQELIGQYKENISAESGVSQTLEKSKNTKSHGGGGRSANANLERESREYKLPDEDLKCPTCDEIRTTIGFDTSEELEYIPGHFKVIEHKCWKYSCKRCQEHVIKAPNTSAQLINRGLCGISLASSIIVNRYQDHLPLYRQEQIFKRQGADVPRSSMCRWMAQIAKLFQPTQDLMTERILQSRVINADETPLKYLAPNNGQAKRGYVWVYLGDESNPYVFFNFKPSRAAAYPEDFLSNYSGYLQTDAYSGYKGLHRNGKISAVCCMAHARRYFEKALKSSPAIASEAIARIAILYDIERRIEKCSEIERLGVRQTESVPRLEDMRLWLIRQHQNNLPKTQIGKAISYALNNWESLRRYAETGFLNIDNNKAENSIRPIAIGRKNWMFLGNEDSGETFSVLASLTSTCKRIALEPLTYFNISLKLLAENHLTPPELLLPDFIKEKVQKEQKIAVIK